MLILANSKQEASQHLEVLVFLLEALGFIINQGKSILSPVQEIEFLGLMVDSLTTQLKLPGDKLRQICRSVADLRSSVSSSTFPVHREAECSCSRHPCSIVPYRPIYKKLWSWGTRTTIRCCLSGQKPGRS